MENLKEERSSKKRKVTVVATRLIKTLEKELHPSLAEKAYYELQEAYIEFVSVSTEYNQLLEADEELKPEYEVVSGLNPEEYDQSVEQTFNKAKFAYEITMKSKKNEDNKTSISQNNNEPTGDEPQSSASSLDSRTTPTFVYSSSLFTQSCPYSQFTSAPSAYTSRPQSFHAPSFGRASALNFDSVTPGILPSSAFMEFGNPTSSQESTTSGGFQFAPFEPAHAPFQVPTNPTGPLQSPVNPLIPPPAMNIKVKAAELPHFSGLRKDWPEFKSIWPKLAVPAFPCKELLACELRRCIKGTLAEKKTAHISITGPHSFDEMWNSLSSYYDDEAESVRAILKEISLLKPVKESDYRGLVDHINKVESLFSQLTTLDQIHTLNMREVDNLAVLLPETTKREWHRLYSNLTPEYKRMPFQPYVAFLKNERGSISRLAEQQQNTNNQMKKKEYSFQTHNSNTKVSNSKRRPKCAIHGTERVNHATENCHSFQRMNNDDKIKILKEVSACFRCIGWHARDKCPVMAAKESCNKCGIVGHKSVLCLTQKRNNPHNERNSSRNTHPHNEEESTHLHNEETNTQQRESHHSVNAKPRGLYAIFSVPVVNTYRSCTVFTDDGSDSSYITNKAAKRLGARKLNKYSLEVTTTGGKEVEYDSYEYELDLVTKSGKILSVRCFGLEKITGELTPIDSAVIRKLFPYHDASVLTKRGKEVDVLLGTDYFGAHPKKEICSSGEHLSIMEGTLGICLQGSHPDLQIESSLDSNMIKVLKFAQLKTTSHHSITSIVEHHLLGQVSPHQKTQSHLSYAESRKIDNFVQGEELGTQIFPKCGSCKCSKCPLPGHSFSFQEESELKLIQENLSYDEKNECWVTKYPWKCDPHSLPDNKSSALATLFRLEKRLNNDENLKSIYHEQMQDMIDRNVARKVTKEEMLNYKGPFYYISHLGVPNPRSKSTPYRIVFNSSQLYKGISLNNFLLKGPDAYLNNQLGILLRWREEKVAIVSDIKKMYNSVHLDIEAQHCHRFLWRIDQSNDPETYCITRVNMGDKPAGAISTEALYMTAEKFAYLYPQAAVLLKMGTYVDDLMDSVKTKDDAENLSETTEKMLLKGGFKVKFWLFSGSCVTEDNGVVQVLGVSWKPNEDYVGLQASLNFSPKKRGIYTLPDLKPQDISSNVPQRLTKRIVLSQMMRIYDPMGLLSPFTLRGKILLRKSWQLNLGWDDALPSSLYSQWTHLFLEMGEISKLWYPRVLKPENSCESPSLIIFSDASEDAYGFVAYARWLCHDGIYRSRLIFSKSRIAPITKRTTPQLELNAAVMSKRAKEVILKEMRYDFNSQILHITDSETVLAMLQKTSTRFKLYEGVRVGEIQVSSGGDVTNWAWISSENNIADWVTRGKNINCLGPTSEWFRGPAYMQKPIEEWGIKRGNFNALPSLPGEKRNVESNATLNQVHNTGTIPYNRFSNYRKLIRVIARILNSLRSKTFKAVFESPTTPLVEDAEEIIIKDLQKELTEECQKKDRKGRSGGKYYRLKPVLVKNKWVVGTRLQVNPLVPENKPQFLLPTNHYGSKLLMIQAHKDTIHRSRDSTLARFRQKFWMLQGSKIANSIVNNCQLCKLRKPTLLNQKMGSLPKERTLPAPPFTYCMVDYFGPYSVCGEVQKRITGKSWGVIFTDMVSRAVFIEAVFECNTDAFLIALDKFASVRGYPHIMYSDPGSNFCAASKELENHWKNMLKDEKDKLISHATEKGMEWKFSSADSPWQNGAVEALVKSAKKILHIVLQNQRLRPSEFCAVLYGVANSINERPIGCMNVDSDLSVITPNSLLLGRSTAKNPGNWHPTENTYQRFNLVHQIQQSFWKQWLTSTAPSLLTDAKWHSEGHELKPGDVVLVQDSDNHKAGYKLAVVQETYRSSDGVIRKARILYKTYKVGDKTLPYRGTEGQSVYRPVQKLALVVPVETASH